MEILTELNELLFESNIENLEFVLTTNGHNNLYSLQELEKFGWKIDVFNDDSSIDEDLEEEHENRHSTYEQMIIKQIKRNLQSVIEDIQTINNIIEKGELS
jgi:hypothetical protein